jgi:hypothetical protein
VIEHHRDLRHRPADIDEAKKEKVQKHFAPRRYSIAWGRVVLIVHGSTQAAVPLPVRRRSSRGFELLSRKQKPGWHRSKVPLAKAKLAIEGIQP